MPISRLEGLKGINAIARRMKGFDGLSYQQQREFLAANEAKLGAYTNNSNSLNFIKDYYDNLQFINRFGKKAFQLTGPTEEGMKFRRQKLNEGLEQERNNLINATFDSTFGNDSNIQDLRNGLDEQGKLDLLRNTNYLTDSQINERLKQNIQKAKKDLNTYDKAHNNSSWKVDNTGGTNYDAVGTLNKWLNDTSTKLSPEKSREQDIKNNQSILDKIFSQVQKRRENSIAGLTDTIYKGILNANNKGVKSLAQSYKDFDTLATKVSNHYAQFKDSEWLSDYSNTDKLKDYAKFMALEQKYGKGIAIQYLDHSIQNRVAKAQDGVWTGNTLKKIGTTFLSDLGSQVAMMRNADAFLNPEAMGLINQGLIPIYAKDKNGNTLHDKQGNPIIVGSKKNDNIWTNPAYWNDMYMYNTTDQHEMELIKQRGGISKYVNINPYGYNPNEHMLSWGTAQEAVAQSGHIFASLAETALLGGIGKGIGLAGKAVGEGAMMAARAANTSAKVLNAMSKTGRAISKTSGVANDILMNMAASMNGPQGESMGTFNEQLEKNTEAVKNQIRKELNDYAKTINYNAPHAKQQIAQYFNQLKLQDQRRLRRGAIEGVKQLPMSDATLMQQAKQMYTNSLLNEQEKYLEYKHNKDYQEAATNAARTYTKNWVADFIKENFITGGIQNYKIAKGALTGALDNTIAKNITADAATGGVKRVVGKAGKALAKSRWQNVVKQAGKQVAGGFADEFLDGLNANMAEGIGDKSFKDYLNKNYNPEAYNATTHGAFANMVAGIDGFIGGLTDRENWYEGIIGALSPFASGAVNAGIITNPINTTRALLKGVDKNGNKLNIAERAAQVITNPILSEYADAKSQDRAIDQRVKDNNELIKNNKTTLNDAAKAMMALNNYSSPLQLNRYKGEDGVGSTILDSEDNKLYNVFTLMDLMYTLQGVEGGTKSQIYQDVMGNMKNIAEGKLSEDEMNDEIDKFLADKDNKSILDKPNAREIAAERLQKNAKFFMDTYKKYVEISNTFARSSKLRNADPRLISMLKYNLLAKDNYKERLNQIESELGVGHTDAENKDYTANLVSLYGTREARENAVKAKNRDLTNIEAIQKANIEANNKALIDRDNAQKELDNAKDENARKIAQDKLDKINNLIESRKFQNKSLDTQKSIVRAEIKELENILKGDSHQGEPVTILSVDGILSMNAADRAAVLDERNKGNYSEFQQGIIEKAREKLKAKDPDALQKIHDAGILHDRIASSNTVYNKLLDNADLATTWLDAQEAIRDRRAAEENIERVLKDSYNKLDDAYDSGDAETLKKEVLGNESPVLDAYMQDNPDKADKVKPYYDMRKFFEDAAAIVHSKDGDKVTKDIMLDNIAMMFHNANSVEDVMKNIEGIIDDPDMAESIKKFFDDLLNDMQKLNYQRDKTTIEKRQERLKREAEEKAKRDAEKARKEAEAKAEADRISAEKAAKEAKEKAESEAKAKAEAGAAEKAEKDKLADEAKSVKTDEEPDNLVASGDAVPTEETLSKEEEEKERSNIENAKQKGEATPISMSWANSLMSDSAEEGSAPAGDMWHSTNAGPRKEAVTANLKVGDNGKRTITFTNGEQKEEIVVKPKDYEVEAKAAASKRTLREALPTIQIEKKSKSGKDTKGQYVDTLDNDGVHHIKFEGSNIAKRSIHKEDLDKLGLSVDDILGKKEEWNNEGYYDEALEAFNEDGVEITEATVDNNGNVTSVGIADNGVYPTLITGNSAKKVFDAVFPELDNYTKETPKIPTTPNNIGPNASFTNSNNSETSGKRTLRESFKEVELKKDFPGYINNKELNSDTLSHSLSHDQAEVLRKSARKVFENPNATYQQLHDALLPINSKINFDNNALLYVGRALDAVKQGRMTANEAMALLEYLMVVDDDVHNNLLKTLDSAQQKNNIPINGREAAIAMNISIERGIADSYLKHTDNTKNTPNEGKSIDDWDNAAMNVYNYINRLAGRVSTEDIMRRLGNDSDYQLLTTGGVSVPTRIKEYVESLNNKNYAQQKPTEQSNKENNKEQQSKSVENRPFHAKSLEKDGDDWYFVGNFEGENKETKVKAKKGFNLDKAIDEQRVQRERLYYKQGDTVDVGIIEDTDGNTFAVGQTLEEQKNSLPEGMSGTIIDGDNTDSNVELNALGESQEDGSVQQLSGYAMAIWNRESLQSEGTLVRDKDEKAPYSRDHLNDWLDAMHINLRNIIDQELFQILRANPQAKVKFMATNSKDFPVTRAFKDDTVSNNLFLVLDYDESINKGITHIHDNDRNGGVIETGDGKKYLIIGVYAYKNGNKAQQNIYNNLWGVSGRSEASLATKSRKQKAFGVTDSKAQNGDGVIRLERDAYFPSHTKERFYVSPNYSTEIVPYSLIPGWNVHRMEHDTEGKHRPVTELMQDKDRNPFGLTIENASWAIQKTNEFLVISPKGVNSEDMSIMAPTNPVGRAGASYILFPAANGRMFCGEITPCMYGDMREGSLKTKVDDLLHQLTSSDHKERVDAIRGLNRIFYFESNKDKKGKTILTNRRGQISFINEDGSTFYTTTIGDSFNMEEFIQKFKDFKPRVNITSAVLSNKGSIKEYSEAGALDTDLGQLALAGSSYGVYSVNLDGSINKPTEIKNPITSPVSDKNYSKNFTNVFYYTDGKLATYRYDKSTGNYSLNGNLIDKATNAALIKQLDYNRQVIDGNITYETEENGYKYYIINDTDSPLVIKINSNYQVKELSQEESKAYIDKVNKAKEDKEREAAAKQKLAEPSKVDDVDLGLDNQPDDYVPTPPTSANGTSETTGDNLVYDPTTGGLKSLDEQQRLEEQKKAEEEAEKKKKEEQEKLQNPPKKPATKPNTQTFKQLYKNRSYKREVFSAIKAKWPDAPKGLNDLNEFLAKKNVEVDSIGTSKDDIDTWIDTLKNCK